MRKKSTRHRAFDPDPDAPETTCDIPGCPNSAGYRAPRSRENLDQYFWFCLEHVREYNARWDFYKGMTPGQIEKHLRDDVAWQRPSWKLGQLGAHRVDPDIASDPLETLQAGALRRKRQTKKAEPSHPPPAIREPLITMSLLWPVTLTHVKSRYRLLARQHHPDANGGDPSAEARFKKISLAYATLCAHLK